MADIVIKGQGIAATAIAYYLTQKGVHNVSLAGLIGPLPPDSHHAQCVLHKGSFYARFGCSPVLNEASELWEGLIEDGVIDASQCNRGVAWKFKSPSARKRVVDGLTHLVQKVRRAAVGELITQQNLNDRVIAVPLRPNGEWPDCDQFIARLSGFFNNFDGGYYLVLDEVAVCPKTVLTSLQQRLDERRPTYGNPRWNIQAFGRSYDIPALNVPKNDLRPHWTLVLKGNLPIISFVIKDGVAKQPVDASTVPIFVIARRAGLEDPETVWLIECETLDGSADQRPTDATVQAILQRLRDEIQDFQMSDVHDCYFGAYVEPHAIRHKIEHCVHRVGTAQHMNVRLDRFTLAPLMGRAIEKMPL